MTYTYEYIGDVPTVFITLKSNGKTWEPKKGDKIVVDHFISHPLLVLVPQQEPEKNKADEKPATKKSEPAQPVQDESPATADEIEESN
jgi:hypothetical protein